MADDAPERDPEIRKRAAWLLGMLALVAALLVLLMVTFFNTSGGESDRQNLGDPTAAPTATGSSPTPSDRSSGSSQSPEVTDSDSGGPDGTAPGSGSPTGTSGSAGTGSVSCPGDDPCALTSDVGGAVAAINAYRTKNGKSPVPGAVSAAAAKCALSNGSDCDGGWAQTQVPAEDDGRPDGTLAVEKIKQLGKLLADMKSIEVGWAYDPGSKQFYFATIRQD